MRSFFDLFKEIVNDTLTEVENNYGQNWLAMGMFLLLVSFRTACLVVLAMISWVREETRGA